MQIQVTFNPVVGNYYPDQGDSVKFSCVKATEGTVVYEWGSLYALSENEQVIFSCGEKAGSMVTDRCKSVILKVVVGTRTIEGTRFKVEIETSEWNWQMKNSCWWYSNNWYLVVLITSLWESISASVSVSISILTLLIVSIFGTLNLWSYKIFKLCRPCGIHHTLLILFSQYKNSLNNIFFCS